MPGEHNPIGAYTFGLLHDIGNAGPDQQSEADALVRRLESHDAAERAILKDYEDFAAGAADEGIRYLMGLIVEDEQRHNAVTEAMADEIRRSLVWEQGKRALPDVSAHGAEAQAMLAKVQHFLDTERTGKHQLDNLEGEIRRFDGGDGILHLMVELMAYDTQKHILMLDYIRKHLQH
jgi:hypothetical protein